MTDQEINEACARKLGIKAKFIFNKRHEWVYFKDGNYHKLKDYCHSIEMAWEVVEFVKTKYWFQLDNHQDREHDLWTAEFYDVDDGQIESDDSANTAPMAICKAFLKL